MVNYRELLNPLLLYLVRPGVEIKATEVQEIEPDTRTVKTSNGDLAYDYLVLSPGSDLAPEAVAGFSEAAHTPYNLEGSIGLWDALQRFQGGRVTVLVCSMPYKCPAAPYEAAMLLDDYLRRKGLRGRCEVEVFTPEALPMGVAGPEMGRAVVSMMEAKNISFNPEVKLTHIDPERKELVFSNHEPAPFDLLAGVPPHTPSAVVKELPVANDAGWIPVDRRTLKTSHDNVYAIGDVAAVSLANGKPLPKAGVFAEGEGRTVARRIADEIERRGTSALGFAGSKLARAWPDSPAASSTQSRTLLCPCRVRAAYGTGARSSSRNTGSAQASRACWQRRR